MSQYRESRIRLDSGVKIDEYGIMTARARIARIGVQTYMVDGELIRELRSEEEVMKSVDSFNSKPVTLNHPPESFVDAKSASKHMKGFSTDTSYNDGWVEATIHITHEDAVIAAQSTHKMFSNGYKANVVKLDEPKIWVDSLGVMGEKGKEYEYDAYQERISGNHVALVTNPRAGDGATFISDSIDDVITISTREQENQPNETNMTEIPAPLPTYNFRVDSTDYSISGEDAKSVSALINTLQGKVDGLESTVSELTSQLETANKTIADSAEVKVDQALIAAEASARTAIWTQVIDHVDSEPDYTLSVDEVKALYLKKVVPNLSEKIDQADSSYIDALWDIKQPSEVKPTKNDSTHASLTQIADSVEKTPSSSSSDAALARFQAARANFFSN